MPGQILGYRLLQHYTFYCPKRVKRVLSDERAIFREWCRLYHYFRKKLAVSGLVGRRSIINCKLGLWDLNPRVLYGPSLLCILAPWIVHSIGKFWETGILVSLVDWKNLIEIPAPHWSMSVWQRGVCCLPINTFASFLDALASLAFKLSVTELLSE